MKTPQCYQLKEDELALWITHMSALKALQTKGQIWEQFNISANTLCFFYKKQ